MALTKIQVPFPYEPKKKNRFYLEFPDDMIDAWMVQSTTRPSVNINKVPIEYMNMKTYVAGKVEWQAIDIEFLDPIGPSGSQKIMEWVRLHVESITGRMGYAVGYAKDLILTSLDPTGQKVERWVLRQCIVTSASFGNNSQGEDGLQMLKINVQPQWCELQH